MVRRRATPEPSPLRDENSATSPNDDVAHVRHFEGVTFTNTVPWRGTVVENSSVKTPRFF